MIESGRAVALDCYAIGKTIADDDPVGIAVHDRPRGRGYMTLEETGAGIDGCNDGVVIGNLLASFMHQRDMPANRWVGRFVALVRARKKIA